MAKPVDFSLPFWARAALFAIRLIPGVRPYAIWIELALAVISNLPKPLRKSAKAEFVTAVRMAKAGGPEALKEVAKKYWDNHCETSACRLRDHKRI